MYNYSTVKNQPGLSPRKDKLKMNRIAVVTHFNGTQSLKTIKEIFSIGQEYKQERRKLRALSEWCAWNRVDRIDIYTMDGKPVTWIIECTSKPS